jgi:O-antigen/teichoic acid export membrane protein
MKRIITNFQSYKWYIFIAFAIVFVAGVVLELSGKDGGAAFILFTGLLVLWFVIWMIATVIYRKDLKDK